MWFPAYKHAVATAAATVLSFNTFAQTSTPAEDKLAIAEATSAIAEKSVMHCRAEHDGNKAAGGFSNSQMNGAFAAVAAGHKSLPPLNAVATLVQGVDHYGYIYCADKRVDEAYISEIDGKRTDTPLKPSLILYLSDKSISLATQHPGMKETGMPAPLLLLAAAQIMFNLDQSRQKLEADIFIALFAGDKKKAEELNKEHIKLVTLPIAMVTNPADPGKAQLFTVNANQKDLQASALKMEPATATTAIRMD